MNLPQTTYQNAPSVALIGMVSERHPYTKFSKSAKGSIIVGTFVQLTGDAEGGIGSVNPGQVQAIADGTTSLLGTMVAVFDAARSPQAETVSNDAAAGCYADKDDIACLEDGCVWMWTENAATQGDSVYVRCTGSGTHVNGQVHDGAAANFVQHPTAIFMSSTTGAGLVLVKIK
ncbi:MAG TPA: hypothetical protein VF334_05695 [Polyangia bacterium]